MAKKKTSTTGTKPSKRSKKTASKKRTPRTTSAGKKSSKKKVARKSAGKKAAGKKAAKKKTRKVSKKAAASRSGRTTGKKKTASRRSTAGKTSKKKTAKRTGTTKTTVKKAAAKKSKKKVTRKTTKKVAKKTRTKAAQKATSKVATKSTGKTVKKKKPSAVTTSAKKTSKSGKVSKGSSKQTETKKKTTGTANESKSSGSKTGRKGITVVDKKARQPRRSRPQPAVIRRPTGSPLLGPGAPKREPLIPSGPSAPKTATPSETKGSNKIKSPFKKTQLRKFKELLLQKRRSLVGDVSQLEHEALHARSGGSSSTPSHLAEQGSDNADQSLSLGLAAADRKLITEIDDALERIEAGTFGICEMTGKPIREDRLRELPWARFSIEEARRRERLSYHGNR